MVREILLGCWGGSGGLTVTLMRESESGREQEQRLEGSHCEPKGPEHHPDKADKLGSDPVLAPCSASRHLRALICSEARLTAVPASWRSVGEPRGHTWRLMRLCHHQSAVQSYRWCRSWQRVSQQHLNPCFPSCCSGGVGSLR